MKSSLWKGRLVEGLEPMKQRRSKRKEVSISGFITRVPSPKSRASPSLSKRSPNSSSASLGQRRLRLLSSTQSHITLDKEDLSRTESRPFTPLKNRSFCIWEGGCPYDLRAKRLTAEVATFLARPDAKAKDYCSELRAVVEQNVTLAALDRKYLSQEKFTTAYDHPHSRSFFASLREEDAQTAIDIATKHPAVLHTVDSVQQSPLHIAVKNNSFELTSFLMEKGLTCDVKDMAGRSPYRIARKKGFFGLMNYMGQYKSMKRRRVLKVAGNEGKAEHRYKIMSMLKAVTAFRR